jgi:hypothetical protein
VSDVKKITSSDGINFRFELNEKFEKVTYDFAGYGEQLDVHNIWFAVTIKNAARPLWQKKYFLFSCLLILFFYVRYNHGVIDNSDWKNYLTTSCNKTLSGHIKSAMYDEVDLWAHTKVSMNMWARDQLGNRDYCRNASEKPADIIKEMQCFARYDEKWDWLNRCTPVVEFSLAESKRK